MKITYVCNDYPPAPHGGIGVFVRTLAHAMKARGHAVTVVGLGDDNGDLDDDGVRVVTLRALHIRRVSWLINRWRIYRWLIHEARQNRIDILEIPDYEGMLPFPFHACPVVVRLHLSATTIYQQSRSRVPWSLAVCESHTLHRHPNWIGVSKDVLDRTISAFRFEPLTSTIIYNPASLPPIDDSNLLPVLPKQFVLFAGTVSKRKGAYTLALAATRFLRDHPSVHLVYAGELVTEDGVPANQSINGIVGPELAPRVHYLGSLPHAVIAACMRRAQIFAFPSTLESFGLVVAEAIQNSSVMSKRVLWCRQAILRRSQKQY